VAHRYTDKLEWSTNTSAEILCLSGDQARHLRAHDSAAE
jgi:hypothetical protein